MDESLPRTVIIPKKFNAAAYNYTLAPGEWLRIESINVSSSVETPLIVWAVVVYTAPSGVDIATMATLPSLVDPPVVAAPVRFTFAIGVTASPTFVDRTITLPPGPSPFDSEVFMQGLPDTVLYPGTGVSISTAAWKVDSTPEVLTITEVAMYAEQVNQLEEPDVVPPYTAQTTALQLEGVAA